MLGVTLPVENTLAASPAEVDSKAGFVIAGEGGQKRDIIMAFMDGDSLK